MINARYGWIGAQVLIAPAAPMVSSTILLHTGHATANRVTVRAVSSRPWCSGCFGGVWIMNHAQVRAQVAATTGYSHQRIGTSRAKIGLGRIEVGKVRNSAVSRVIPRAMR